MVSTSGTVSSTTIRVVDILEDAMKACGLSTAEMTPENWVTARNNLYFYLSALANDGLQLWTLQKYIIGMIPGQSVYPLDIGAVDVMNACYRTVNGPGNTSDSASSSGTASYAFDGNIDTSCTQTAPNGYISYNFGSAVGPIMFGILPNGTQTYNLVYEYSSDNLTWNTLYSPGSQSYTDLVWTLNDVDLTVNAQYWRVRETGGATLNVREVMFGVNPTDINIGRISNDIYAALPNKFQQGPLPLQYWVDRQRTVPVIHCWPVPNSPLVQIVTYRRRQIQDPGSLTNELEVPQRWISAIVKNFAVDLIMRLDVPDAKRQEIFLRRPILERDAQYAWMMASMDERDDSAVDLLGGFMGCYTGFGG